MRYTTHFTADFTAHFTAHGGPVPDEQPRPNPHDLPDGAAQPVLIPEPDVIGKRVPFDPTFLDAFAAFIPEPVPLTHPHERPHTDDHRSAGAGDTLPVHVDTLDTWTRAIGRAAGIDVGPPPDRHPSRAQRLADLRRDLELGTD